jgi:hypothetical protein
LKGRADLLLGVIAAAATALLLALIAATMPPHMIREDALVAASIMVAVVAISWRKPKQRL